MATLKIKDADSGDQYLNVIGAGTAAEPYQSVVPDYRILYAINQIFQDDAVTVSVAEKGKSLIKFGRNDSLAAGTAEMVWRQGGFETYKTANDIDIVVSTAVGDTQEVVIEGHTLSGSDFTFVTQTATLNGTTNVTLTTPLARANRLYNNGTTDFAGVVTVEDNGTSVHLSNGAAASNQSQKAATTLSSVDYWIITELIGYVDRQNAAAVNFELQIREYGKVFRTIYEFTCHSNSGTITIDLNVPIIAPPNSDVRLVATSSANSTGAGGSIGGYLAIIT